MKIFPNSVSRILNIRFSKTQRGYLYMLDLNGKCILKMSIHNQSHVRLPIRSVGSGLYILQTDELRQEILVP